MYNKNYLKEKVKVNIDTSVKSLHDSIEDILPEDYTQVTIEKKLEKGFDYRTITIETISR